MDLLDFLGALPIYFLIFYGACRLTWDLLEWRDKRNRRGNRW